MRLSSVLFLSVVLAACGSGPSQSASTPAAAPAAAGNGAPTFTVDPTWPKIPLPNNWIIGAVTGVFVDAKDHVWVTHLPETLTPEELGPSQKPPIGTCCVAAPSVLEFDQEGNLVQGWGDASQDVSQYPRNPHGIFVDNKDFVWVGTYMHHRVMKFTRDGKLVLTIGTYDKNNGSNDPDLLGGPAGIWVDPKTYEVYVADGYKNRRVVVYDGETGKYLRHWGAYGERPDDNYDFGDRDPNGPPPRQFSTVHGIIGSTDGLIYVADRRGNRVQVFDHAGKFIKEKIVAPETRSSGSAFCFAFSPDEKYLYLADGTNHKVWTLLRDSLEIVGEFGQGGHFLGQMLRPHGMYADSKGNLYVGEASTGRRVQRFLAH